jgi:hypothetical protein
LGGSWGRGSDLTWGTSCSISSNSISPMTMPLPARFLD